MNGRLLVVDDHEIVREGLRRLLAEQPDLEIVGVAADGGSALAQAAEVGPDLVLLDMVLPSPPSGLETLERLRRLEPAPRVLVLSSFAEPWQVRRALAAGADGYLLKDVLPTDLVAAIRAVLAGQPALHPEVRQLLLRWTVAGADRPLAEPLTGRELTVLEELVRGASNAEIAGALAIGRGTVRSHLSAILAKLGAADRTQAALRALRWGLVADPEAVAGAPPSRLPSC